MKFVLFVEGHTERKAVPRFLKRWLDPQLTKPVGVKPVRFEGWAQFDRDVKKKAHKHLEGADSTDVIAVVGLLDLYGPTFYPDNKKTAVNRVKWASQHFEKLVNRERYRHFCAVHEVEAWLLSQPSVFNRDIQAKIPEKVKTPEKINFDEPPAQLLNRLYKQATRKNYKKVVYGHDLFGKLDPTIAYSKCPNLKALLDTMLDLAKEAGL